MVAFCCCPESFANLYTKAISAAYSSSAKFAQAKFAQAKFAQAWSTNASCTSFANDICAGAISRSTGRLGK